MARRKRTTRREKGAGGYWYDESTGRHFYRYKGKTVADKDSERAKTKFEDLKRQVDAGIRITDGRQPLRQYATRYLTDILPNEVKKDSTLHDYTKRAGLYILPTLGDFALNALSIEIGLAWRNAMVEKGWARSSINQALALAKRILDSAVTERLIPFNPFAAIKPVAPKEDDMSDDEEVESTGKVMTLRQVEAFLQAVQGDWLEPLYRLAFFGPRRGELLGFRWNDYDKDRAVLRIRQQVIALDGKAEITKPKTKSSRRTLPLLDEHVEMLEAHRLAWWKLRNKHHETWQDTDLMFCTRNGTPINPRNLLRHFYAACKRAGIVGFRFHDLRHTANQLLADAQVAPKVRAAILGHSRVQITEDVYTHASEEAKRAAITKLRRAK